MSELPRILLEELCNSLPATNHFTFLVSKTLFNIVWLTSDQVLCSENQALFQLLYRKLAKGIENLLEDPAACRPLIQNTLEQWERVRNFEFEQPLRPNGILLYSVITADTVTLPVGYNSPRTLHETLCSALSCFFIFRSLLYYLCDGILPADTNINSPPIFSPQASTQYCALAADSRHLSLSTTALTITDDSQSCSFALLNLTLAASLPKTLLISPAQPLLFSTSSELNGVLLAVRTAQDSLFNSYISQLRIYINQ